MPDPRFRPTVRRAPTYHRRVRLVGVLVGVLVLLAGCTTTDPSADDTTSASSPTTNPAARWAALDRDLAKLGPHRGFLAARVSADGTCHPVHQVAATTPRPIGSQFKLFVLGALAEQVADRRVTWDQTLTTGPATQSLGNEGSPDALQHRPAGTSVTVQEAATQMISISDNTATDMLIGLVGRDAVEAQSDRWQTGASANRPFLTTRQMLLLHYAKGLGSRYVATPRRERAGFLASQVDPRPLGDIASGYTSEPRFIQEIEWFATPDDVCRAFGGLHRLARRSALSPQLDGILGKETIGIGLDRSRWRTVWYKGGSEAGVLTLGWLAVREDGTTFVVEAMVSNPKHPLAEDSITDLRRIARRAFARLA